MVEVIVEKIVEVPVEKIVYREVKVPEIREKVVEKVVEKIVEKVVYKDAPAKTISNDNLATLLNELITNPGENPKPMADFVIYLMTSSLSQYHETALNFCLSSRSKRFFA